jgi:hypothetical protein
MAGTIYQSTSCNIPEEQHLQKYTDEATIFMIIGRRAPRGVSAVGHQRYLQYKSHIEHECSFFATNLLVPQKGLQGNQQKTSTSPMYMMMLMAECLPHVWTI